MPTPSKPERFTKAPKDDAHGDVQDRWDQEQAQGFLGAKVDPLPNSAYSLQSGPDSPRDVEDDHTRIGQPSNPKG